MKVVVNDESYVSERALVRGLAALYRRGKGRDRLIVAQLCDDFLDHTGRLLGLIRDEAVKQDNLPTVDEVTGILRASHSHPGSDA